MKQILIITMIILMSFAFAQQEYTEIIPDPPVEMTKHTILLTWWTEPIYDEDGIEIGLEVFQKMYAQAFVYDENGIRVIDEQTQGSPVPYMNNGNVTSMEAIHRVVVTNAKKMLKPSD